MAVIRSVEAGAAAFSSLLEILFHRHTDLPGIDLNFAISSMQRNDVHRCLYCIKTT
jgi:hypothetical protein